MSDLQTSFQGKRLLLKNLPVLPAALHEAQRLADNPNTTLAQLAEVIGHDQALAGNVLKMVNAPTYGFPRRITSVQNALVLLGFHIVKSLLLSAVVFESASGDMSELARHSSGCAVACRELGRLLKMENTDEFFVAGLLHDIGKVVAAVQLPEAYEEILRLAREQDLVFLEAEERVLGMTHPHIGAWLAEHWNLPASLHQALAYHHRPASAPQSATIAYIVHVGNFLTCLFEYGNNGSDHVPSLDPHAFKHLDLNQRKLGMAVDVIGEIFEQGKI
jgi:HD-like signal output (HDOD) protein